MSIMEKVNINNMVDPNQVFQQELALIHNDNYREAAKILLSYLPNYFYVVPSSSSGKYHPSYSNGPGGLVLHTRSAIIIATELNRMVMYNLSVDKFDLVIISLMLHDGLKYGFSYTLGNPTLSSHPKLMSNYLQEIYNCRNDLRSLISIEDYSVIMSSVHSHSGQWNGYNDYPEDDGSVSSGDMPTPTNKWEFIVHLSDYLSSRRFFNMDFTRI